MPKSARPLVIRFGRLVDMILLQPLLHRLQLRHGSRCHILTRGGWTEPLYAGHADVAAVTQFTQAHRAFVLSPERWRAVRWLRRQPPTPIYVCEPEPRALDKVRELLRLAGLPDEHCRFAADTPMHAEEHWVDYLLRFGAEAPPAFRDDVVALADHEPSPAPRFEVSDADRADLAAWLRELGIGQAPLILLQPANKRTKRLFGFRDGADDDKFWPAERWGELARRMRASVPGSCVLICGSPTEAAYAERIRASAGVAGVFAVAAALPLRRLLALAQIAHSMVSVDTGPAHLAAAMGCPLVVLFGRVSPHHWMPRSPFGSHVIDLGGPTRGGRVDGLGIDEVAAAWRRLRGRRPA
ncbi:MAG: glycosyltransferase family 9 protein [Dokdonella sp.]